MQFKGSFYLSLHLQNTDCIDLKESYTFTGVTNKLMNRKNIVTDICGTLQFAKRMNEKRGS